LRSKSISSQPNSEKRTPVKNEGQPYHHGDLRAALISAALVLIERHGIKGFTLKDAAVMAGVSTAAPYRHFADKDALLEAVQLEGFQRFNAALAEAFYRQTEPEAQLLELGVAYVRFALDHAAHMRVMFGFRGGHAPEPVPGTITGYDLLVEGVRSLFPDAPEQYRMDMVVGCWSAVHGYALLQMDGAFAGVFPAEEVEAQLRRMLRLMVSRDRILLE
jgi:AcrR family transcriptional regulator